MIMLLHHIVPRAFKWKHRNIKSPCYDSIITTYNWPFNIKSWIHIVVYWPFLVVLTVNLFLFILLVHWCFAIPYRLLCMSVIWFRSGFQYCYLNLVLDYSKYILMMSRIIYVSLLIALFINKVACIYVGVRFKSLWCHILYSILSWNG